MIGQAEDIIDLYGDYNEMCFSLYRFDVNDYNRETITSQSYSDEEWKLWLHRTMSVLEDHNVPINIPDAPIKPKKRKFKFSLRKPAFNDNMVNLKQETPQVDKIMLEIHLLLLMQSKSLEKPFEMLVTEPNQIFMEYSNLKKTLWTLPSPEQLPPTCRMLYKDVMIDLPFYTLVKKYANVSLN